MEWQKMYEIYNEHGRIAVKQLYNKYRNAYKTMAMDFNDVQQECLLVFWNISQKMDLDDIKDNLKAFVESVVRKNMFMILRKNDYQLKLNLKISDFIDWGNSYDINFETDFIDECFKNAEINNITISETEFKDSLSDYLISENIDNLTEKEYYVLYNKLFFNYTWRELGEKLLMPFTTAQDIYDRTKKKLKSFVQK
jgi:RNA polymerase sigma factor (sigma-70 family)